MITGIGRISESHKEMLDELRDALDFERPKILKIALAKGIESDEATDKEKGLNKQGTWDFQWTIMSSADLLLFKHLIIQQQKKNIDDEEMKKYMQCYIENGLEKLMQIKASRTSLDDLRFSII